MNLVGCKDLTQKINITLNVAELLLLVASYGMSIPEKNFDSIKANFGTEIENFVRDCYYSQNATQLYNDMLNILKLYGIEKQKW